MKKCSNPACDKPAQSPLPCCSARCEAIVHGRIIVAPVSPEYTRRETIAEEAQRLIGGEKRDSYGSVQESFERIAAVWNALIKKKLAEPLSPADVALLMSAFKLCRESHANKRDNRVDAIAYLLLMDSLIKE